MAIKVDLATIQIAMATTDNLATVAMVIKVDFAVTTTDTVTVDFATTQKQSEFLQFTV